MASDKLEISNSLTCNWPSLPKTFTKARQLCSQIPKENTTLMELSAFKKLNQTVKTPYKFECTFNF